MPFAALDLHRKAIEAVVIDDDGRLVTRERIPAAHDAIEQFAARHLTLDHVVAVEATFNTWAIVDILAPWVKEVVISNPLRTRAIAEAKIKTDKVDAMVLAQLLRLDYLPRVWQPDPQTQQLRRATTERAMLTADRTRIKNRIHAILHQRLLTAPMADLFSPEGLGWLKQLTLDRHGRAALDRQLRLLDQIEGEIAEVTQSLAGQAYLTPQVKLLMTLPGVDFTVAQALLAALGDINRFPTADQAAAYLGLVPSTRQSGQHCYHGPITKQGRSHARWLMVQAAQRLHTQPGPLGVFFRRIEKKKNRNVAVVATARKLVTIAWHMLRNNEPYRYSIPATTRAKLDRLRIRATGKRKQGGFPKGSPRPAAYGSGSPTRGIPSLAQIYATYELPPLSKSRPGERTMIERRELTAFVEEISKPRRIPKTPAKKQ
jgi:transposase